jgi:hypothetical protein
MVRIGTSVRYPEMVRKEDIVAFANRDRTSVALAKEAYWARKKQSMTPAEALTLGDRLRRDALLLRPSADAAADRIDDLANHARVAEMLRLVGIRRGR